MSAQEATDLVNLPSTVDAATQTTAAPGTPKPKSRPSVSKPWVDPAELIQVFRAADGRIYPVAVGPSAGNTPQAKTEPTPEDSKSQPSKATPGTGSTEWIEVYRAVDGRLWSPQQNPDGTIGVILEGEEIEQLKRSPKMSGALPKDEVDGAGEQQSYRERSPSPGAVDCVRDVPNDGEDSRPSERATENRTSTTQSTTSSDGTSSEEQTSSTIL